MWESVRELKVVNDGKMVISCFMTSSENPLGNWKFITTYRAFINASISCENPLGNWKLCLAIWFPWKSKFRWESVRELKALARHMYHLLAYWWESVRELKVWTDVCPKCGFNRENPLGNWKFVASLSYKYASIQWESVRELKVEWIDESSNATSMWESVRELKVHKLPYRFHPQEVRIR